MITDSFDAQSKPIITLKAIYGEQGDLADVCIVTFSKVIFDSVLASRKCERIAEIGACNGNIPIYSFRERGRRIAFYLSPIGATGASQCIEDANWLTGAEHFITFGSAGSLAREVTENRFVIPTEAYRDEGMSYHYAPPADYIGIGNSGWIRRVFEELHLPVVEGKVWTTDSILRETVGQMEKRRAEGCVAVEMEIAGVQAVCDFHRLHLYPFLVTGDVLSEDGYDLGTLSDANNNLDKFQIALELAVRIPGVPLTEGAEKA